MKTQERILRGAIYFVAAAGGVLGSAGHVSTQTLIAAVTAGAVAVGGYLDKTSGATTPPA